jgi:hypothetical protein
MAALKPDAGGTALQPGLLAPCLLASQSSVTFPTGLYLSPGPSEAKGGITRELLDDMGEGLAPMPSPFHWGLLSWTQVLGKPGQRGTLEEHMVAGLEAQVPKCCEPQISFLLLFH